MFYSFGSFFVDMILLDFGCDFVDEEWYNWGFVVLLGGDTFEFLL